MCEGLIGALMAKIIFLNKLLGPGVIGIGWFDGAKVSFDCTPFPLDTSATSCFSAPGCSSCGS
jgi:hypothetical protein